MAPSWSEPSFTISAAHTARSTLLPNLESGNGAGLLGSFDFIRSLASVSSPREDFYEAILTSDTMLDLVLEQPWTADGQPIDLFELLGVEASTPATARQRERLRQKLRHQVISFSKDQLTSFMTLRVELPRYPALAADVCNFLIERLEDFNRRFHQEHSRQQRVFLAGRVAELEAEMHAAEDSLSTFMERNRGYASSPQLTREFNSLYRDSEALGRTWLELRSQYELARIEEHKNLSSINVLDPATPPVFRSKPQRAPMALVGGLLGGLLGLILAWRRDRQRAA
ncbi:MAG: hypothetical protein R3D98_14240 [Candidatus Krumholzibacteriia bacterium]